MISVNDFKTGVTVELDGAAYQVVDFQHVKPGKGAAFVRAKLKNLQTGATVERTFRGGEKISKAHVDRREMQYLYNDGQDYICMDNENYEQISISKSQIGDGVKWLLGTLITTEWSTWVMLYWLCAMMPGSLSLPHPRNWPPMLTVISPQRASRLSTTRMPS
jgi:translation elongation factor P